MQNSEFEKNMQQKMDELKFVPSDAVWDKVEAGLPKKEKNRRWIFLILFFAALLFGSLVWLNKTGKAGKEITATAEMPGTTTGQTIITPNNKENKNHPIIDTGALQTNGPVIVSTGNNTTKQKIASASFKIKIKNGVTESSDSTGDDNLTSNNQKKLKTGGIVKTKIKTPVQYVRDNEKNEEAQAENEENDTIKAIKSIDSIAAIVENKTDEKKIINSDSLAVNEMDTAEVIVSKKDEKKKAGKISKWQYGIYLALGSSNVTNKLFNGTPVFATLNSSVNSPGSPVTPSNINTAPNNPLASLGFSIGFFASKHIGSKWKFSTGINYMYQSNSIKIGSKVDTAVALNFDLNKSISTSNYYRAGNTTSYKNKFHLVEMPLLFQFNFSGRPALYFEAGPTISYLVNSNALVYNANSSSYITDPTIFNRLLLFANAGVGINILPKSKLPFSVGYQFKYGAVSAVKKYFGKQHFVNSLLYLKIPVKK